LSNNSNVPNWKMPIYAIGAAIGLALGFLTAHLYTQAVEEKHSGIVPQVEAGDVFRLGLAALAFMRQITDLAARGEPER